MESAIGKAIRLRSVLLVAVSAFAAFGKHGRIRFFFTALDLAIDRGLKSGIQLHMDDDINLSSNVNIIQFQRKERHKIHVSVFFLVV